MVRLLFVLALLGAAVVRADPPAPAAPAAPALPPLEKEVGVIVSGPQVTIVHFWAPWCPNCRAEMTPEGWAKFVGTNPDVQVVFINFWHRGQSAGPALSRAGLGGQPNFVTLEHPNPASKGDERTKTFLGLPVTWLPTTWVFRDGKLRYALNYGEVRFDMLQQLVNDSKDKWAH